jgi:myxalamid-type polyketide synthase MxaB
MSSTSERIAKLSPQKLALLKQAMGESNRIAEPIAIVGMGCRFAGAANIAEYWRLIHDGIDATGEIPASRWDVDAFYDASGTTAGRMPTRWGGFIDDMDRFDAAFFGISPREAEKMDPQHRLLLEVVWEALEYGGIAPTQLRETATGVFVGVGGVDYSRIPVQLDNYFEQITAYSGTGNALSIAANRISYTLDLRGPSMAIDTACSSSLVAAHLAVRSLRSNECDAAIVGGVNAILTPETTLAFSQAHMLSPDGKCRPFDDGANGYVRGEGCGVVVLKRLSDAISNGDMILATIRGSAVNQDGTTSGITAPRGASQVDVIKRALRDASCKPDEISYVEAHGTATPLGDPIEIGALTEVFRARSGERTSPCYVGSVKSNIGHTETAAGMASLIKTVLMCRHQTIPGQAHFHKLNRHLKLDNSRLQVASERMAWDAGGATPKAGISSFGFGGTNAHLVIEAATNVAPPTYPPSDRPKHIMAISAKNAQQLRDLATNLSESIVDPETYPLADACYTAAVGRAHFRHRLAIPVSNSAELKQHLDAFATGTLPRAAKHAVATVERRRKIAFLFPGQGTQTPGMGRELFQTHRVFREALESCDAILADILPQRLLHVLYEDGSPQPLIHQPQYTQSAIFSVEYALSRLWRSFGIEPTVMLGHSIGDYVAACEAGVFTLAEGLTLVAHRGRLVQSLPADGKMAVVFSDRDHVAELIRPYESDVAIAAHNGPQNVVISGRCHVVDELIEQFHSLDVKTIALEVSSAMHSPLLDPVLDEFEQRAAEVDFQLPKIPLISSRTGQRTDAAICQPAYWRDHLRHTVCFADAAQTLQSFSIDAAIEVGAGTTLCGLASRVWSGEAIGWLPSLRSGRADWDVLSDSLSDLFVRGINVDWKTYDEPWSRRRLVMPTYPFEETSYWYDMSRRQTWHLQAQLAENRERHPLLGSRVSMAGDKTVFEVMLDAHHPGFLADHCVDQSPVVPAAAYMEQALAAALELFGEGHHALDHLVIDQALVLAADKRRCVQVHVGPELRGERSFEIYSRPDSAEKETTTAWTLHASGTIKKEADAAESPEVIHRDEIAGRMSAHLAGESFYQRMAACGLRYGNIFQIVSELHVGDGECLCRLDLSEALQKDLADYVLHPAVMDGCLQSIAGVVFDPNARANNDLVLPTHAEQVRVFRDVPWQPLWIHTRRTSSPTTTDAIEADIVLMDDDGNQIAEIVGARVQRVSKRRSTRAKQPQDLLYAMTWHEEAIDQAVRQPRQNEPGRWLLFADAMGVADQIADSLCSAGHDVRVVEKVTDDACSTRDDSGLTRYQLDPLNPASYERLFDELSAEKVGDFKIVDCWAMDSLDADNATTDEAEAAKHFCSHTLLLLNALAKSASLASGQTMFVTRGAEAVSNADAVWPAQTAVWGMVRTAMVEMPHLTLRLVDLDPSESTQTVGQSLLVELQRHDEANQEIGQQVVEDHVALRGDRRFVARLEAVPTSIQSTARDVSRSLPASERFSLRVGESTSLDELHYVPIAAIDLGPDDVEIEVSSTGLNFSDVLKALGLYPGIKDEIVPLGIECAGVVSRVGANVERFQIGQRVMGVAPYSFASHTTTAQYAIVATPDNLSDDEAATIPITFLTAHHALCSLARLAKHEKVLIHAGAGGVGLAAIQIAQSIGAEIFATAGSEEKREFLRSLGVQHVMDSRTLDFADEILDITKGQGVDVVLNSLPGEAITVSLSILAAYGRFLEIGKTDIYQNRRIGLLPFQDNLSYRAIDLDRMLRQRPDDIIRLYDELMPLFEQGVYQALPLKAFSAESVVDAFRYMSQRKNIGKVVVSLSGRESQPAGHGESESDCRDAASIQSQGVFADAGTILITGGLGALGQQVAQYAARGGARHLAILTRRSPDELAELDAIAESGVSVAIIQGDVCDRQSLSQALASLPKSFPPVRGVFHAAGVLRDGLMQRMDLEQLHQAMSPKTQGAWNLHREFADTLDFFVLFSSVAGVIGSPGQANYAAGNAFLDGLARHRRHLGLPATSIAWGPWDSAGMASDPEIRRQLGERGMSPLAQETGIHLLDLVLQNQATNLAVVDADWQTLVQKLPRGGSSLFRLFQREGTVDGAPASSSSRDEQLFKRLQSLPAEPRLAELVSVIAASLSDVMGVDPKTIEPDQPLATMGLDSLMGMELRTKLEAKLGIAIPMASLFDNPSVMSLARISNAAYEAKETVPAVIGDEQIETSATPPVTANGQHALDSQSPSSADDSSKQSATNGTGKHAGHPRPKSGLVALGGSRGTGTPVFCLHPIGGDLRCYDGLARVINDRPVYGLRPQGLQPGSKPHPTLDAMVDDYVKTIRGAFPVGPYCLMGWSTGGIFAYEIARKLHSESTPVQSLMIFDTPQPHVFRTVDLDDNARFLCDLIEFTNHFANTTMQLDYEKLHQLSEEEAISSVLALAIENRVVPTQTTPDHLRRLVLLCKQHVRFLQQYEPPECDLTVDLFCPLETGLLATVTGHTLADDLGWGRLVALRTHHVPGNHFTMMTSHNAARLAEQIDGLLNQTSPETHAVNRLANSFSAPLSQ